MIRKIVPEYIERKYAQNKKSGQFEATALFLDITDFTVLTEKVMQQEKEGAEYLSELLNNYFQTALSLIYHNGGFVVNFLGDGFSAIFPDRELSEILSIADQIRSDLQKKAKSEIYCKIGIAQGEIKWKILETEIRNHYFFFGEAFWQSSACEKKCKANEIIFWTKKQIKTGINYHQISANYYFLDGVAIPKKTQKKPKDSPNRQSSFIDPIFKTADIQDEFRDIIPCFVTFSDSKSAIDNIKKAITLTHEFGGYCKEIIRERHFYLLVIYFGTPIAREKLFLHSLDFVLNCKAAVSKSKFGITFGKVFSGFIKTKFRSEFLAIGKIVNLASRLCSLAKDNQILLAGELQKKIRKSYQLKFCGRKKIKGFQAELPVYELLAKKTSYIPKKNENFFGRHYEISNLQKSLDIAENSKKLQIVNVLGEAGIGKTFLVKKFRNDLKQRKKNVCWFKFCSDEVIHTSFNPIISTFKQYFAQNEKNNKLQNKHNFEIKYAELLTKNDDPQLQKELKRTKTILGSLLGLPWQNSLYEKLDAKGKFENTIKACLNLIKIETTQHPVILQIEDEQWLDEDSRLLFQKTIEELADYPLLIITTSRDQNKQRFVKNFAEENIKLAEFSRLNSEKMIAQIFQKKVTSRLVELIWQRSEGNPFYLEQICNYLIENKLVFEKNGLILSVQKLKKEEMQIPISINSIIVSRIDKLTSELKEMAKAASVLGREFSIEVLSRMLQNRNIFPLLAEGKKKEIWDSLSELIYIFKHSLIRHSIYNMQFKKQLMNLHRLAAETIEEIYHKRLEEHFDIIAYHFEQAKIFPEALKYWEKAGDQAKAKYHNQAAIEHYQRILKITKDEKLQIDILLKQSEIFRLLSQNKKFIKNIDQAGRLAKKCNDENRLAKVKMNLGIFQKRKGEFKKAGNEFFAALIIFQKYNDEKNIAEAFLHIAVLYTFSDEYDRAKKYFEKALQLAENLEIVSLISAIAGQYGILLKKAGDYQKSMKFLRLKIELSEKQKDIRSAALAYNNMGNMQMNKGEYNSAEKNFLRALRIMKKIGDRFSEGMITGNLGIIYMNTGHLQKAINYYRKSLAISKEVDDTVGIAINNGNLAIVFKHIGKFSEALECVKKRIKINKKLGDRSGTAFAYGNLGNIWMDLGDISKAKDSYQKMLDISEAINYKIGKTLALANLGNLYAKTGNEEKADNFLDAAIELERKLDLKDHLAQDLNSKVQLLLHRNDIPLAKKLNEEARNIARKIDSKNLLFETELAAAEIAFITDVNRRDEILRSLQRKNQRTKINRQKAKINALLGRLFGKIEKFEKALDSCETALKYYQKLNKKISLYQNKLEIDHLKKIIRNIENKRI